MSVDAIIPIKMPKWGLSMQEGTIMDWAKCVGDAVNEGDELVDVETSKITNVYEAPASGTLRRILARTGDTLPVGALLALMADPSVEEAELDAFVVHFNANFVVTAAEDGGGGLAIREVIAAGVNIRAGIAGQGQDGIPAVLLHGFGGDLENWTLVMGPLSEDRPVYALELPGHGQSQKVMADASVASLARVILGALDVLEVERAHLVGHSLGGAVALAAALHAPARIASLSLVSSAGLPGAEVNQKYLDGFIEARRARDLQPIAEMLFADKSLATKELVEGLARFKRIDGVEEVLRAIRDAMVETEELSNLAGRFGELRAPLLVLCADKDEVVSLPTKRAVPPEAMYVLIEGSGHLPQIERAEAVVAALRRRMQTT